MERYPMSNTPHTANPQEPEKKDEDRKIGGFWWWSPAYLAAIVLGITGWYFWYLTHQGHKPVAASAPAVVQPAPQPVRAVKEKIESAYFFRIDGKDKAGNAASFDFIVLSGDYTWALGSTTDVVAKTGPVPQAETVDRVLSPKIRESLASASDLIAVGVASSEGEREAEEARALARSQTVSGWLTKAGSASASLWSLTLGQYSNTCKHQQDEDTSFERPIIFSGVRAKAGATNLQEALADAIGGHDNLPSAECYSRFDMTKVR
jgi:hypothetical protein